MKYLSVLPGVIGNWISSTLIDSFKDSICYSLGQELIFYLVSTSFLAEEMVLDIPVSLWEEEGKSASVFMFPDLWEWLGG